MVDAIQAPTPRQRLAALEAVAVAGAASEQGAERLPGLVADGLPRDEAAAAAWRLLWGPGPALLSRRATVELANAARILDRCAAGHAEAHGDVATWLLVCDMLDYRAEHDRGSSAAAVWPASIGFFIRRLRRAARQERHGWRSRRGYAAARAGTS